MADNKPEQGAPAQDDAKVVAARKRVQGRYAQLKHDGGWRAVAEEIGSSNVSYVYNFAELGVVPTNYRERHLLLRYRPARKTALAQRFPEIPTGLHSAILTKMREHVGRAQALSRADLVEHVHRIGYTETERAVREAIKQLRRQQHLILSMPGNDGGYYMAASLEEVQEFDRQEIGAKIADMNETRQAMLQAARKQFGEGVQLSLIT